MTDKLNKTKAFKHAGFLISLLFLFTLSCEKKQVVQLRAAPAQVRSALPHECSNGGVVVEGVPVCNGLNGANGANGNSIGATVVNSTVCSNGGKHISLFNDLNSNGTKDTGETLVSDFHICNGENAALTISSASLSECPNGGVVINGQKVCNGLDGSNGADGVSLGVQVTPITCSSPSRPGKNIEFFKDLNNNNTKDMSEPIVSVATLCDGANGADGASVSVAAVGPGPQCPNGGVLVNGIPVCNGLNGLDGVSSGSNVIAAKLCPSDTDTYAEYGFFIGTELYAVLYDDRSSHPHKIGLVRVPPGSYVTTTTGTPRSFTYTKSGTTATLTCGSASVTYDLSTGSSSSSSGPFTLTGVTCLVKLKQNYGHEKHYQTTVTGSGISGDYYIDYSQNNSSYMSTSGCFSSHGFWTDNNCLSSQYQLLPMSTIRFTPISGSMSYYVYLRGNSLLQIHSAVLTKISTGQKLNCTVDNSMP